MHSERRAAINDGLQRRQVRLLEAIAAELGADVDQLEQCRQCGEWYKQLSSHTPHCDGYAP